MILGFKDRFLPFVKNGTKTHTIRAGARWRAGMRVDIFEAVRQGKRYEYLCENDDDDCDFVNENNDAWEKCPTCKTPMTKIQVGGMKLLFRAPVRKVESVVIDHARPLGPLHVTIDGNRLSEDETQAFFWRDGFRRPEAESGKPAVQAKYFWAKQLKAGPFVGQIIHWDYDQRKVA